MESIYLFGPWPEILQHLILRWLLKMFVGRWYTLWESALLDFCGTQRVAIGSLLFYWSINTWYVQKSFFLWVCFHKELQGPFKRFAVFQLNDSNAWNRA